MSNDLPQNQQTLVDVDALLGLDSRGAGLALLLRTSQVDQLEPADCDVRLHLNILDLNGQREDAVTSARELVQVVRRQYLVLRSELKEFQSLLWRLALEHVQVFHYELVLLGPSDPEAAHVFVEGAGLPELGQASDARRVQQIKYLFVINLEVRAEDADVPGVVNALRFLNLLEQVAHTLLGDTLFDFVIPQSAVFHGVHVPLVSLHGKGLAAAGLPVG